MCNGTRSLGNGDVDDVFVKMNPKPVPGIMYGDTANAASYYSTLSSAKLIETGNPGLYMHLLKRFHHPNVVPMKALFETSDHLILVMKKILMDLFTFLAVYKLYSEANCKKLMPGMHDSFHSQLFTQLTNKKKLL